MNNQSFSETNILKNSYLILNNKGEISDQLELFKPLHILGRNSDFCDLIVPNKWNLVSGIQATIKKIGTSYYIYDGDGVKSSTNKIFINNNLITPREGYLLQNEDQIFIGQDPKETVIITFYDPNTNQYNIGEVKQNFISLKNISVILGRDENADLQLNSPIVSRKHAQIKSDNNSNYILYDLSANGVFIDDKKVEEKAILRDGCVIKIGPYSLVLQKDNLIILDRGDYIRLEADNISLKVKNKEKYLTLLNNITLPIEPGQFIVIVGGSGAGKSTLMRTLLGIESTTEGTVYLNGKPLRNNFNIYRNQIGYVPQMDIVHKDLKVEEVLRYTAKLRLPPDTNIDEIIERTLRQIEMSNRRNVLIKKLSGGQLKRVSIGVELLADPKLFFLDEPTSGLDSGLDKKMMQLLRRLSNEGRTVILVTHATTSISLCDRLVFMGTGGNLCYFGKPENAYSFFNLQNNEDLADIYLKLETQLAVKEFSEKFKESNYYQEYITEKLTGNKAQSLSKTPQKKKGSFWQQLMILIQRYYQLILRDKVNLIISLLTAPIGILLINLAINKEPFILGTESDPTLAPLALKVLFVFTCAAIWVGFSCSLQEIIKENDIYLRERLVNLNLLAYIISKKTVLGLLANGQTLLMSLVIIFFFSSPENATIPWFIGINITSLLTIFSSICLGLMISAFVKNSTQSITALPLLFLPQIIFSGVLFTMEGGGKVLSWITISRWSVGAYGSLVKINDLIPEPITLFDGTEIARPFEPNSIYDGTLINLFHNWGILILYSFIYLIITYCLQKRKDIL